MKVSDKLITTLLFMLYASFAVTDAVKAEGSYSNPISPEAYQQTTVSNGSYCAKGVDPTTGLPCTNGFDPANITCTDQNGNGWIDQGECSWGDTSTPWFSNPAMDTQKGNGITPGGSGASFGQTSTTLVSEPHFTVKYFNAPSAPGTTATSGVTSQPSGGLTGQHNEFGFEITVDKKTDPLEPYYLKFSIPYTTVDSSQSGGNMVGNATGVYSKEVTEMDPNNPGVFYRYTITGTYMSTGNSYSSSSNCTIGCTSDQESTWRSQWP
ncbi:MAG: hypothetical protein IT392_07990 [Nitrospirae bacterium]|nr:hypothetical protein [Nitrospirota bacterium]